MRPPESSSRSFPGSHWNSGGWGWGETGNNSIDTFTEWWLTGHTYLGSWRSLWISSHCWTGWQFQWRSLQWQWEEWPGESLEPVTPQGRSQLRSNNDTDYSDLDILTAQMKLSILPSSLLSEGGWDLGLQCAVLLLLNNGCTWRCISLAGCVTTMAARKVKQGSLDQTWCLVLWCLPSVNLW